MGTRDGFDTGRNFHVSFPRVAALFHDVFIEYTPLGALQRGKLPAARLEHFREQFCHTRAIVVLVLLILFLRPSGSSQSRVAPPRKTSDLICREGNPRTDLIVTSMPAKIYSLIVFSSLNPWRAYAPIALKILHTGLNQQNGTKRWEWMRMKSYNINTISP